MRSAARVTALVGDYCVGNCLYIPTLSGIWVERFCVSGPPLSGERDRVLVARGGWRGGVLGAESFCYNTMGTPSLITPPGMSGSMNVIDWRGVAEPLTLQGRGVGGRGNVYLGEHRVGSQW